MRGHDQCVSHSRKSNSWYVESTGEEDKKTLTLALIIPNTVWQPGKCEVHRNLESVSGDDSKFQFTPLAHHTMQASQGYSPTRKYCLFREASPLPDSQPCHFPRACRREEKKGKKEFLSMPFWEYLRPT